VKSEEFAAAHEQIQRLHLQSEFFKRRELIIYKQFKKKKGVKV
jgi:hypothetical protein